MPKINIFLSVLLIRDKKDKINLIKFEFNTFNIEKAENIDLLTKNSYVGNQMEMITIGMFVDVKSACLYFNKIYSVMVGFESLKNLDYIAFIISEKNLTEVIENANFDKYLEFFMKNIII